ncbi:hypothetical protein ACFL3T_02225 [Patescibacteria group bacterium]
MNKLTTIFIIVTVLIVSVVGTLLGIRYFSGDNQESEQPLYVAEEEPEDTSPPPTIALPFDEPEGPPEPITTPSSPPPSIPSPFDFMEEEELKAPIMAGIDLKMINDAGFKDNTLDISEFDGIVFNDFNMAEYNDDDHILYILLSGEEESAKITELFFPSLEISNEVYASLKAKMADSGYFELNETNQYGDHSYFANHATEKNSVFLVVKIRERLYTLHYPAKNHNKIKNLINQL